MAKLSGNHKNTSSDSKRHFTVVIGSKEHGLYISSTPSSAAKKAVIKLCASNKGKKIEFSLREITQGSKKKVYGPYIGYIDKLKGSGKIVVKKKKLSKKGGMKGGEGIDDIQVSIGDCGKKHIYSTKSLFKKCVILSYGDRRITIGTYGNPISSTVIQVKYFQNTRSIYYEKEKISLDKINLDKFKTIIDKLLGNNSNLSNISELEKLIIKILKFLDSIPNRDYNLSNCSHFFIKIGFDLALHR
jgi:hypothetical protein